MDLQDTTRVCRVCGETKPIGLFRLNNGKRMNTCKACVARVANEYYHRNKEQARAKVNAYRKQNGDKVRAQEKAGKDRHREKIRERNRVYSQANADRKAEYMRERYQQTKPQHRDKELKRLYGLTTSQYTQMLDAQGGVCAICRNPPTHKRLSVDHDHRTGKIRGLLCASCNFGLGRFKDNADSLERAAAYLRKRPV